MYATPLCQDLFCLPIIIGCNFLIALGILRLFLNIFTNTKSCECRFMRVIFSDSFELRFLLWICVIHFSGANSVLSMLQTRCMCTCVNTDCFSNIGDFVVPVSDYIPEFLHVCSLKLHFRVIVLSSHLSKILVSKFHHQNVLCLPSELYIHCVSSKHSSSALDSCKWMFYEHFVIERPFPDEDITF